MSSNMEIIIVIFIINTLVSSNMEIIIVINFIINILCLATWSLSSSSTSLSIHLCLAPWRRLPLPFHLNSFHIGDIRLILYRHQLHFQGIVSNTNTHTSRASVKVVLGTHLKRMYCRRSMRMSISRVSIASPSGLI